MQKKSRKHCSRVGKYGIQREIWTEYEGTMMVSLSDIFIQIRDTMKEYDDNNKQNGQYSTLDEMPRSMNIQKTGSADRPVGTNQQGLNLVRNT